MIVTMKKWYGADSMKKNLIEKNKIINEKNIQNIILLILYLQPILDVITGLMSKKLNITLSASAIFKIIILLISIIYIMFINKTKYKKISKVYIGIILAYLLLFLLNTLYLKDTSIIIYEMKNTINTFFFPIITVFYINLFLQYKINIDVKHYLYISLIYILLIIIPNITNTAFQSYAHSKEGMTGWFLSANGISAILSILMPLVIINITKEKKKIINIIYVIGLIYVIFSIGTKVPVLSLVICIAALFIYILYISVKNKQKQNIIMIIISTIILLTSTYILVPKTSFYKNLETHKNFLGIKKYSEIFTNYHLVDHFIFSSRLTFFENSYTSYKQANISSKMLGIGYIENYKQPNKNLKTIEIDYLDVFCRHGIVGSLIFFTLTLKIICICVKKIKENFTLYNYLYIVSILLILMISLFAGHVLVSPAVSIYAGIIFTNIIINNDNDIVKKNNLC